MRATLRCAVAVSLFAWTFHAQAALVSFEWTTGFNNGGLIPDGNSSGWQDVRVVSTSDQPIQSIAVTLNVSGGFNGDLYAYLEHDSGFAILLNRPGRTADDTFGYGDAGFVITLNDRVGGTIDIHSYGGNGGDPVTGIFQSDGRDVDPSVVLDTDLRNARLTSFNGLDPNGTWTLFFTDESSGEQSTLISWGLEIQTVPEPVSAALGILAGMATLHGLARRRWGKRRRS